MVEQNTACTTTHQAYLSFSYNYLSNYLCWKTKVLVLLVLRLIVFQDFDLKKKKENIARKIKCLWQLNGVGLHLEKQPWSTDKTLNNMADLNQTA